MKQRLVGPNLVSAQGKKKSEFLDYVSPLESYQLSLSHACAPGHPLVGLGTRGGTSC